MKNLLPNTLFCILIILTISYGCRSSKKALEQGNYYESCMLAIQKLRSSPTNSKASESLKQAYPLLIKTTQLTINNTLTLNTTNKYRTVYNEYVKLNTIYQNILTCPAALKIIPSPESFMNEQNQAQKNAINETIAGADVLLAEGTHTSARQAYYIYGEALTLDPSNSLAKERQAEAFEKATNKVVLEQIPVIQSYNLTCEFFYDQIFTSLNNDRRSQFLAFYRPDEAERLKLIPDHIIIMAFDDFIIGQTTDKKTITDVSRDSVIVGSVKMPDGKIQDVYNIVTAKLTITKRSIESKGTLSIQINDFKTNQLLSHEKFEGVFVWENMWGKYRGDSRALSEKQLAICDNEPVIPPSSQEFFLEITKPIFTKTSDFLIQFYKNPKYAQ